MREIDRGARPSARLKALELQGYKTFASKTVFEFSPSITAIVGPNGSGKSNIADAIRWVLGEQSYSLLRGKKTEDMIFAGSESRARASMASAVITFDNSDGWLPIDFSEVTVGRRAYRDGQNEYLLNGQRVRLRDVTELLAESGLAERTYTIIGQGLVDAALSLKAEERRRLFEEAAGIELYRSRREETLRRLENTQRNLERVQDIAAELRPRLRSLERQAGRAKEYGQVAEDLKAALRTWYGYQWYRAQDLVETARSDVLRSGSERDRTREAQERAEHALDEQRDRMDALRSQLQGFTAMFSSLYADREKWGRRLAVSQERLRWLREQESQVVEEVGALETEVGSVRRRLAEALEELRSEEHRLASPKGPWTGSTAPGQDLRIGSTSDLRKTLEALAAREAAGAERRRQLEAKIRETSASLAALLYLAQARQAERRSARAEQETVAGEVRRAEAQAQAAKASEAQAEARLDQLATAGKSLESRLSSLKAQQAAARARWEMLAESTGRGKGLQASLEEAARRGTLTGLIGGVRSYLRVAPEHRRAIAAALGVSAEALAFRTMDEAFEALRWLSEKSGAAVLLSLEDVRPAGRLAPIQDPDCLGNAADFVDADPRLAAVVQAMLGRTLLVRNRAAARSLLPTIPSDGRLVTLEGEVFSASGLIVAGEPLRTSALDADRSQLETKLGEISQAVRQVEHELAKLGRTVDATRAELEAARSSRQSAEGSLQGAVQRSSAVSEKGAAAEREIADLGAEVARLESARARLRQELARAGLDAPRLREDRLVLTAELERAEAATSKENSGEARLRILDARRRSEDARARLETLSTNLANRKDRLIRSRQEQAKLQAEQSVAEERTAGVEDQIQSLTARSQTVEAELQQAEESRRELGRREREARTALSLAEQRHSQAQVLLARREEEVNSLKRRIEDDFGLVAFDAHEPGASQEPLPLAGLVERLPKLDEIPQGMEAQINRLRAQLRRIGAVNPDAEREHDEVRERVDFLSGQLDDLRAAESQIRDVIGELDVLMEREFRKTFEAVAAEFRTAFTRLFGGGSARLILTDPEDLTGTGIDIEARLPGRREQGLSMLSGGERSLAASALIFALLRVSPTPFCVLDEVDAMLDESNVLRFCEMVQELSQHTQFLLITHNRQTVQIAEAVYGVSMGQDSASKLISLRLDEAVKEIAA